MINQLLIKQILDGNQHAFNMLTYKWQKPIFNFCLRYVGDHDTAKDIVQMVFLKIYQRLGSLDDHSRFSSWIHTIARNLCLDEIKRKKFKPIEKKNTHLLKSDSAKDDILKKETAEIIKKALQKIPQEQREVIILKTYQDLKFIEIAKILDISINTVKSRMYHGLKALTPYVTNLNPNKE